MGLRYQKYLPGDHPRYPCECQRSLLMHKPPRARHRGARAVSRSVSLKSGVISTVFDGPVTP